MTETIAKESATSVANFFIQKGIEQGSPVTPMQVIKLTYISHGWNLGFNGTELFDDDIQAWKYGPVIESLYHEVKSFGNSEIDRPLTVFEFKNNSYNPIIPTVVNNNTLSLLEKVWEVYKDYSAVQLSSITHQENTPWDITWNHLGGHSRKGVKIATKLIKEHYETKIRDNN